MPALSFDTIYKAFKENLTATILSLFVLAIIALFGLLYKGWLNEKDDLKKQIADCNTNVYTSRVETKQLRNEYFEVMGTLKEIQGQMKTLKDLGIIK